MNMTEQRMKHDKAAAIGQLCQLKPGESIIYNIGETPGPHGRSMYWLANRGGLALVQRAHGPVSASPRTFTYIAQRTAKAMPKEDVRRAFNPKEW
jgi:hypothetical protein